jgi:hypothetical protein
MYHARKLARLACYILDDERSPPAFADKIICLR